MNENHNESEKYGWGLILICIGGLLILGNLGIVPSFWQLVGTFWPMLFIFMSLLFHVGYYSNRKNVGLLVPGGIFLTLGIVFQSSELWNLWGFMWPGIILAPAVGLFELYIFGKREKGLLIPVGILTGLSVIFFSMTFRQLGPFARYMVPILLIVIGLSVLIKDRRQQYTNADPDQNYQQDYYDNQR